MTSESLQKFHETVAAEPEWQAELNALLLAGKNGRAAKIVAFSLEIGAPITLAEARSLSVAEG